MIYILYVASSIKTRRIYNMHRLLTIISIITMCMMRSIMKSISRFNISSIIMTSNINMRVHRTCKIIVGIIRCICKLYLGVIVVVLWCNALVLHGLELDHLAEFSNSKRNTLQNYKRDQKGQNQMWSAFCAKCNGNDELKKIDQWGVGLGQEDLATK
jgi:hypothetical protein